MFRDAAAPDTERLFQSMLDAAPDAMLGVVADGTIVMANAQAEAAFGYRREELVGMSVETLIPERLRGRHPTHRAGYFAEPKTRPMGAGLELAGLRADGSEFPAEISLSWIETAGGVVALAAIREITDPKLAEKRTQAMIDAAPDAMIGVDRTGTIVMANAQTLAVFGYDRADLLGRQLEILLPERAKTVHSHHRDGYFQQPRVRPMGLGLDLAGRRADGSEFPAEISLSWVETDDGPMALGAIRDITERKRAEQEMHAARVAADRAAAELAAANHELQAFSYAVAHDLRAPLRAIHGFSEALVEDHGDALDPDARRDLDRIVRNVRRMGGMIDALLELSRLVRSTLEARDVDLSAIARDAIDGLREAEPQRDVTPVIEPGVVARGDAGLLGLLLQNLLSNAWKFTASTPGARIEFGVRNDNGDRAFFVRDDGVGFDPRYADKLFTPFQRLHADDYGGSGIGLATAERIVRRHGGRIWADGVVDGGATFSFTLGEAST
ncbi:MAG: sensor histidine kinase [Actinomycetota bacterium]